MSSRPVASFSPADRAARWTRGLLVANVVIAVVATVSGIFQIELLSRAAAGISDEEAGANDSRQQIIGVIQFVLILGTAVAFLMWFHRAHKNLPALGGRLLKYSPGWAVGGFFVPFLNLARPFLVMREVWHGSDPSGLERDRTAEGPSIRNRLGTPALVGWWWALFLVAGLFGNIATRLALAPNQTIDELQLMSVLLVISDVLDVPSALVAILLVAHVTRWQAQRIDRLRQESDGTADAAEGHPAPAM